jgi:L-seryl-tRNA(Ser) seleniumtransferase
LKLFLDESIALSEVPTLQMLRRDLAEITNQAKSIASRFGKGITGANITTISGFSQMGSGSLPTQNLATMLIAIQPKKITAELLSLQLRRHSTPIFTRIQNNQVLVDPRTLREGDDRILIDALTDIFKTPAELGAKIWL